MSLPQSTTNEMPDEVRPRPKRLIAIGAGVVGGISALVSATTLDPMIFVVSVVVGCSLGAALGAAIVYGPRNRD